MHNLLIGAVSDHTMKYNREMVSKEYDRQIKDKEVCLRYLNLLVCNEIKCAIIKYVKGVNPRYTTNKLIDFGETKLSKLGERKVNQIYHDLNLHKDLVNDKDLCDEILELKFEKERLGL